MVEPQLCAVMGTPTPRNDSAASRRITCPSSTVATTVIGAMQPGRIVLKMRCRFLAPRVREASTYSRFLRVKTWLRVTRANCTQFEIARTITTFTTLGPKTDAIKIRSEERRVGKEGERERGREGGK